MASKKKTPKSPKPAATDAKAVVIPPTITFHNIKSPSFLSVPADGAWGGINGNGIVHMVFFSERPVVPMVTVNKITPAGALGEEITEKRESKEGFIRQLEVDVAMPIAAVTRLHGWLGAIIQNFAQYQATSSKAGGSENEK